MSTKRVFLVENVLEPKTWTEHHVESLADFLTEKYQNWPANGRIYHNQISQANDVTPHDEDGDIQRKIDHLFALEGDFYIVIYPSGPTALIIAAIAVAVLAVAALLFLAPKAQPSVATTSQTAGNRRQSSPNNDLSSRKNTARVNGRIPDIYGTVRSTPDLIAPSYSVFVNHQEVEYAYMCIGRGEYEISDIRDDTTLISNIAGASVEIYGPNTSPNTGDLPIISVGNAINTLVRTVTRVSAVNGQTLRPPNDTNVLGNNNISFVFPNELHISGDINFEDKFEATDVLNVIVSSVTTHLTPSGTASKDFSGVYTILSVDDHVIILDNPSSVNSAWLGFSTTDTTSGELTVTGPRWVGPFTVKQAEIDRLITNIVATNGLYKDDGFTQTKIDVQVEIEITPVDNDNNALSGSQYFYAVVEGSAVLTNTRAITREMNPAINNNIYRVRARRVTPTDLTFAGTVVDEVKWRDLYTGTNLGEIEFGDVTTVQAVTYATTGALTIKERKLNMLVTRKVPEYDPMTDTFGALIATNHCGHIFAAMSLDEKIGNRQVSEIDFVQIFDILEDVENYFGTDLCISFCYTFDDNNLSYEETATLIADVAFCNVYRQGNKIKFYFEKLTEDSSILFNHRNKIPGTETRTIRFGTDADNDGIEYEYASSIDDAAITYYVPEDQSATNPKKIKGSGVRSKVQAHLQAYRLFNKLMYQNIASEFDATDEAKLLIPGERILVADNTRTGTQDGEIVAQDGLTVTTSQDLKFAPGVDYIMFLQLADGTVESVAVTAGTLPKEAILGSPPSVPLVVDSDRYVRTTYMLVGDTDKAQLPFLVNEKTPKDAKTTTLGVVNYSDKFYQNDQDFINDLVSEEEEAPLYSGDFLIRVDHNVHQLNLADYAEMASYTEGDVYFTIVAGAEIYSISPAVPALTVGVFPPGVTVYLTIEQDIVAAVNGDALDASMVSSFDIEITNNANITNSGGSGYSVRGYANITWIDVGTLTGPTI